MALTSAQRTLWEVLAGLVALVVIGGGFVVHERSLGAQQILTHVADSTHAVALKAAALALHDTVAASNAVRAAKDSLARSLARSVAARTTADSIAKGAADERTRAEGLLADSLASRDSLRAELRRSLRADSLRDVAREAQSVADRGALAQALTTIAADSVQHIADTRALTLMQGRAESAERVAALLKKDRPSTVGNMVRYGLAFGVGILAGQHVK